MNALLIVSDGLVIRALERVGGKIPRASFPLLLTRPRYRIHEVVRIGERQYSAALAQAWSLCPDMAVRHNLHVDPGEWADRMNTYTLGLVTSMQPHTLHDLAGALTMLTAVSNA